MPSELKLPQRFTLTEVVAVHAELRRLTSEGQRPRIDASNVDAIDTAGLQLLATLQFDWIGVSAAVRTAAALIGLHRCLKLPPAQVDVA